jgi:hypothetical protein
MAKKSIATSIYSSMPVYPILQNKNGLSQQDIEELNKYNEALHLWQKKAAKKGRSYTELYLHKIIHDASDVLCEWLKSNGAPEEIITIAGWLVRAEYIRMSLRFIYESEYAAADIAVFVHDLNNSIRKVKGKRISDGGSE